MTEVLELRARLRGHTLLLNGPSLNLRLHRDRRGARPAKLLDEERVRCPGLGHTAHTPGFDSRLFLHRNCSRIFPPVVGNRGFRTLTRAAPIQIAWLLEQHTPLVQALNQLVPIENSFRIHCYLLY